VRKLLSLAAKNTNEAEAASAAAKAQELLVAYNLDMSAIGDGTSESGKREDARQRGGMYTYERRLWNSIADLNFCFYFRVREYNKVRYKGRTWSFKHRLVGRKINTTATKMMGDYLQGTIERICRERFPDARQFFSSEAVAYREGMASAVLEKLADRRRDLLREEQRKARAAEKAARSAGRDGVSTATALTITSLKKSEQEANYDFMHGEGAWARKEARKVEWAKEDAERRAAQAKADAEAEAAYAEWAKANPEEAAKEAAKDRARERARERARSRRSYSYRERAPTGEERRASSSHYYQGYDKGKDISIDQQVDCGSAKRIGR
jgi:hypothetical protein